MSGRRSVTVEPPPLQHVGGGKAATRLETGCEASWRSIGRCASVLTPVGA